MTVFWTDSLTGATTDSFGYRIMLKYCANRYGMSRPIYYSLSDLRMDWRAHPIHPLPDPQLKFPIHIRSAICRLTGLFICKPRFYLSDQQQIYAFYPDNNDYCENFGINSFAIRPQLSFYRVGTYIIRNLSSSFIIKWKVFITAVALYCLQYGFVRIGRFGDCEHHIL